MTGPVKQANGQTENFWSRRKLAVQAEEAAEHQALATETLQTEQARLEGLDDADLLDELGLPDPDTLQMGDDIHGFMAQVVPDRLRRRAMRQLWKLNPVLANLDGLVDYGEDYTDAATVIENMQSAYQVGKGMLAHVEEMARQAELKAQAEADTATDASTEELAPADDENAPELEEVSPSEVAPVAMVVAGDTAPAVDLVNAPVNIIENGAFAEQGESEPTFSAPRRMRFEFTG